MKRYGIERITGGVEDFLIGNVNALLPEYEDEDVKMPLLNERNILHGAVDVSRSAGDVTVSITVEEQTEVDDGAITEHTFDTSLNVVFICSRAGYDVLVSRASRYASALKKAMLESPTFGGRFTGSGFGSLEIDYDAGAVGGQMTAAAFRLTVRTNELTEV